MTEVGWVLMGSFAVFLFGGIPVVFALGNRSACLPVPGLFSPVS